MLIMRPALKVTVKPQLHLYMMFQGFYTTTVARQKKNVPTQGCRNHFEFGGVIHDFPSYFSDFIKWVVSATQIRYQH